MWTYWIPTAPPDTRLYKRRKGRERTLTVYALKSFDYFPKAHSFSVLCGKVRQDAGTQGDLLVKVSLLSIALNQDLLNDGLLSGIAVGLMDEDESNDKGDSKDNGNCTGVCVEDWTSPKTRARRCVCH